MKVIIQVAITPPHQTIRIRTILVPYSSVTPLSSKDFVRKGLKFPAAEVTLLRQEGWTR